MTPVSREEIYLTKLAGGSVTVPTPVSRNEMYLAKALRSEETTVTIQTVSGSNTLTIDTTLQPSSVSITGNISQ